MVICFGHLRSPISGSYTDGATFEFLVYCARLFFRCCTCPRPQRTAFTDLVSLNQFQFFKSGTADSIGTVSGPANVQLAILNNIYADLTNLSTSSPVVVGTFDEFDCQHGVPWRKPITFTFNGLPLQFGSSYGAVSGEQ